MSRLLKSLLSIPFCFAGTVQADTAQDTLKRFVDGVQTFDARFDQTQTDERGKVTARSSGRFLLSRPAANAKSDVGRFRWAYEKPYEQLSICDGAKLWAFDPDLNQATVRNAKTALAGTPAALLSQRGGLTDAFVVQDGGGAGGARVVRLLPKAKDGDFKSIADALPGPVRRLLGSEVQQCGHQQADRRRAVPVHAAEGHRDRRWRWRTECRWRCFTPITAHRAATGERLRAAR